MTGFLRRFFGDNADDASPETETIVVVSGLPRSGTSMMMKLVEAGGIPVLIDGIRTADDDNPKGYYEFERVKALDKGDTAWLPDAQGRVVKVISALLEFLPPAYEYKVIFMRRKYDEVLRSQRKMLQNRDEEDVVNDEEMAQLFDKHLQQIEGWLAAQPNMDVLYVDYNAMLADPAPDIQRVDAFLPQQLDLDAMSTVVDPTLYRNRVGT